MTVNYLIAKRDVTACVCSSDEYRRAKC